MSKKKSQRINQDPGKISQILIIYIPEQQSVLGVYDPEPLKAARLDVLDAVALVQHHVVVAEPKSIVHEEWRVVKQNKKETMLLEEH